jgi:hypothetical protein
MAADTPRNYYIILSVGFVEDLMGYRKRILFEKLALQVSAVVCLAGVFFLLAPRCAGSDPLKGVLFVVDGNWQGALLLVAGLWVLALIAGVGMGFVRPQGAMMVPLVGMMGVCLYSAWIRPWLWEYDEQLSSLYLWMIVELLLGAGALFVAGLILDAARRFATDRGWSPLWTEPIEFNDSSDKAINPTHPQPDHRFLGLVEGFSHTVKGIKHKESPSESRQASSTILGFAVNVVVSLILVMILLKSSKRGQAVFAVGVGCLLGTLIVQYLSPIRALAGMLLAPVVGGLIFYGVAAASLGGQAGPEAWMGVKFYALPLPIDWLFAGPAGAMLGAWLSHRMIETGYMEKAEAGRDTKESIDE